MKLIVSQKRLLRERFNLISTKDDMKATSLPLLEHFHMKLDLLRRNILGKRPEREQSDHISLPQISLRNIFPSRNKLKLACVAGTHVCTRGVGREEAPAGETLVSY